MRFLMTIYPNGYQKNAVDVELNAEAMTAMGKFNDDMARAGVLLTVDGLRPPAEGVRITFPGGKARVQDGPFTEAKELVGGYWLIEVKSREEAIAWASRCPAGEGDMIEVRQVQEFSDFPQELQDQLRAGATHAALSAPETK
jgi:hypothetical protein